MSIKTRTKVGGSPDTRNRKWWMDGNSFYETLYGSDKRSCGIHKTLFQLDDKLHYFNKKGSLIVEITCQ